MRSLPLFATTEVVRGEAFNTVRLEKYLTVTISTLPTVAFMLFLGIFPRWNPSHLHSMWSLLPLKAKVWKQVVTISSPRGAFPKLSRTCRWGVTETTRQRESAYFKILTGRQHDHNNNNKVCCIVVISGGEVRGEGVDADVGGIAHADFHWPKNAQHTTEVFLYTDCIRITRIPGYLGPPQSTAPAEILIGGPAGSVLGAELIGQWAPHFEAVVSLEVCGSYGCMYGTA